jgi:hypothetical protein
VTRVHLDPGLDGMASLPNVGLTALTEHGVCTRSLEFQVILYGLKEAGDVLQG